MSAGTPAPEIICRCATLCGFIAQLDDQAVWRLIRGEKDAAKFKDSTLPVGSSSTPAAAPTLSRSPQRGLQRPRHLRVVH